MQFSQTPNGLSQTRYSLCIPMAVTGMQNSDFFHLWKQVNTSLSQTMTNAVLALHMVTVLEMFSAKRDPVPQAVLHLLSALLALFTLAFFTCKVLDDFFFRKNLLQSNKRSSWVRMTSEHCFVWPSSSHGPHRA